MLFSYTSTRPPKIMVASSHIKLIVLPRTQSLMKKPRRGGSMVGGPKPIARSPSSKSVGGASSVSEWSIMSPDIGGLRACVPPESRFQTPTPRPVVCPRVARFRHLYSSVRLAIL